MKDVKYKNPTAAQAAVLIIVCFGFYMPALTFWGR